MSKQKQKVILSLFLVIIPNLCSAEVAVITLWDPLRQDYYLNFYYLHVPNKFIIDLPRHLTPPRKSPTDRTYSDIEAIAEAHYLGLPPLSNVMVYKHPFP
ncbi:hypothetical protein DMENIID0001_057240 [Sergentomyia squamirostris]